MNEMYLDGSVEPREWESRRAKGLFDNGRIIKVGAVNNKYGTQINSRVYVDSYDILRWLFEKDTKGNSFNGRTARLSITLPQGWRIRDFTIRFRDERQLAYEVVKDLGFVLTEREEKCWATWIRDENLLEDDEDEVDKVLGH
jgi:hypothetical protein